jgi:hypothetical protein
MAETVERGLDPPPAGNGRPEDPDPEAPPAYATALAGCYGGELWAELERNKLRAGQRTALALHANDAEALAELTAKLRFLVDQQRFVERQWPTARRWGQALLAAEAEDAQRFESAPDGG